mgnify:CR=1 FL=1
MNPDQLTFEPEGHIYRIGKRRVASVTQILKAVGYTEFSAPWFNDKAKDYGKNLHECCALVDEDDLIMESVAPEIRPEVEAYAEWKEQTGFMANLVEKPLYSLSDGFAGTPDVFGSFPSGDWVLIDRKRGQASKATRYQLALYVLLVCEYYMNQAFIGGMYPFQIKRYALDGFSTGKPKIVPYTDRNDIKVAKAILSVYHAGVNSSVYKNGSMSQGSR